MLAKSMAVALASVSITGCLTAAYQGNEDSPYFIVPAGTQLSLHERVSFDPGQLSVYVQNGRVMGIRGVRHYEPFCKFELRDQSDTARAIAPTEMVVTRSLQHVHDGTFSRLEGLRIAGLSLSAIAQVGGFDDGGSPILSYITRMDVRSDQEPEIFRMSCLRWSYPDMAQHLSITEIRRTLSPLFTLRLPGQT